MKPKFTNILNYFNQRKDFYHSLQNVISKNTDGRIPHHNIAVLNVLVNMYDIKTYLEIGVHNGASMSYVVKQNKNKIDCYGIDLFCQDPNYQDYNCDSLDISRSKANVEANNESNSTINLIAGNSLSQQTLNKVNHVDFDLVFIDGDHSYNRAKSDFTNYSSITKPGGFIVLDDCLPECPGIMRLAGEIKSEKNHDIIGNFKDCDLIIQKR